MKVPPSLLASACLCDAVKHMAPHLHSKCVEELATLARLEQVCIVHVTSAIHYVLTYLTPFLTPSFIPPHYILVRSLMTVNLLSSSLPPSLSLPPPLPLPLSLSPSLSLLSLPPSLSLSFPPSFPLPQDVLLQHEESVGYIVQLKLQSLETTPTSTPAGLEEIEDQEFGPTRFNFPNTAASETSSYGQSDLENHSFPVQ